MSDDNPEYGLTLAARAVYANYTMSMVVTGIHLFMALYGLSVFLETPESLRKGRKRYIAASFVITILSAFTTSLDIAGYFQVLFQSTSPGHWGELIVGYSQDWEHLVSTAGNGVIILLGDALLVYRCYIICVEHWWMAILPMMTSLSGIANAQLHTGVIAILIESAAPLTIFGVATAILNSLWASVTHKSLGILVCSYVFDGFFYSFCALSPHMIIFRVTTGRSFTKFPSVKDGVLTNPIQFVHQTAESSFLQSTSNREFGLNCDANIEEGLNTGIGEPTRAQLSIIHIAQEKQNDGGDVEKAG
ncbi:hypothetical protein EST38_g7264 [Candolleomyces aberdarensis]|uniref:Uncharacterized protein n=1 Tax=Candolleomyces aberdarensis TaxID=2316362 RepID=A0A4Q2DHF7_9AGAR|nr:hypothetical protein EST38_g7264 [Candolleomyces aberdarensis]